MSMKGYEGYEGYESYLKSTTKKVEVQEHITKAVTVTSNFLDVCAFHKKFNWPAAAKPSFLDKSAYELRKGHMQEELNEFCRACESDRDMHGAADALADLVYVAMGTARLMGIPWEAVWDEVHRANMQKEAGVTKRGHKMDAIKPKGWVGPDHTKALGAKPYEIFCTSCGSSVLERVTGDSEPCMWCEYFKNAQANTHTQTDASS